MVDRLFSDTDFAALHDHWWAREPRKDFGFYLPLVMSSGAVLDAGCGTGALLHEARRRGHSGRLCGLDPAAAMAQARRRTDIEWTLGDLPSARWLREFDLVIMTGHAFQVLIEDHELRASLAAIRGPNVLITTHMDTPFDGRIVSFTHTFTSPVWDQPRRSQSTLRFLDANTLSAFLTAAGLVIEEQFGDWDRQPLTAATPEHYRRTPRRLPLAHLPPFICGVCCPILPE